MMTGPAHGQMTGVSTARRSLMYAFDDDESDMIPTPAKLARASSDHVHAAAPDAMMDIAECSDSESMAMEDAGVFLFPLPPAVSAEVVKFLTFEETAPLSLVVRGACPVLALRTAWDPMVISERGCEQLLRHLRQWDPLGTRMRDGSYPPIPRGIFQVHNLSIFLMSPDRVGVEESDEEDERCRTKQEVAIAKWERPRPQNTNGEPTCRLVLDPLEEVFRRLRYGFTSVLELKIANMEDHRLDYRFLDLRTTVLRHFSSVRVIAEEIRGRNTKYSVIAHRHLRSALQIPDERASLQECRARASRAEISSLLEPPEEITPEEASFLQEHCEVVKSKDLFHVVQAPWRTYPRDEVRKRYHGIIAAFCKME